MVELSAPEHIVVGRPFTVSFTSTTRVAGRIRLTAGTEAVPFTLERDGRPADTSAAHRVRGRSGTFRISEWGEHPAGSELVLRFEGAKKWLTVVEDE